MSRANTVLSPIQAQHRALTEMALSLDAAVTRWDVTVVRAQVVKLRDALDAHVALENREFYPTLNKLSVVEPDTERLVKLFDDNMRLIADGLRAFFSRFADKPELDQAAFTKEWKSILSVL